MNELTIHGGSVGAATMTSLEISKLVESRHDKVKQSIERLSERGVISLPPMGEVSNDGPGPRTISVYRLCKRDSLIAVAQLCPEFTARVVDRWQELENQCPQRFEIPKTLSGALMLAAKQAEEIEQLQEKAKADAPKVAALGRIAESDGGCCLTVAAKTLQQKPQSFFAKLREWHWIYRHPGGKLTAHQEAINRGYLEHKVATIERPDGTEKSVWNIVVTPKGLARMAVRLGVAIAPRGDAGGGVMA